VEEDDVVMRGSRFFAASAATMLMLGLGSGCSDGTDVAVAKQGPAVTADAPGGPPPKASNSKQGSAAPKGGGSPAGKSPQDYSK
jgi:hypothetical protein